MSTRSPNAPMPVLPPPSAADPEMTPLLSEPFARAWAAQGAAAAPLDAVRGRLLQRTAATRAAEAPMHTVRRRRLARVPLAGGAQAQALYQARDGAALRAGEPRRAWLLELQAGARLPAAALPRSDLHREWLVLDGDAAADGQHLSLRDYHVRPAGCPDPGWSSEQGALIFVRESEQPALPGDGPATVLDAEAGWPEFAPGIRRRVLWARDGQAALLYHAEPGAAVPQHRHGHDEECLMVQGELFLDDLLLQPGDYQLAPCGSGHRVTQTDTGVVIYAHGDLDLQFV